MHGSHLSCPLHFSHVLLRFPSSLLPCVPLQLSSHALHANVMMTFDSDQGWMPEASGVGGRYVDREGEASNFVVPTIDAPLLLVRGMYVGTTVLLALSPTIADFHGDCTCLQSVISGSAQPVVSRKGSYTLIFFSCYLSESTVHSFSMMYGALCFQFGGTR
jgi:hypothetical protein